MFSKLLKVTLIDENLTAKELAERLGTSQQNLSAKIKRDNFSEKEMISIAEALGYYLELKFEKKR